jgi:hypothetical protein
MVVGAWVDVLGVARECGVREHDGGGCVLTSAMVQVVQVVGAWTRQRTRMLEQGHICTWLPAAALQWSTAPARYAGRYSLPAQHSTACGLPAPCPTPGPLRCRKASVLQQQQQQQQQ